MSQDALDDWWPATCAPPREAVHLAATITDATNQATAEVEGDEAAAHPEVVPLGQALRWGDVRHKP